MSGHLRSDAVAWASLILALCLTGCGSDGPERGVVTGKVTLNGEPLENADVEFQPEEGSPSYGMTDRKGWYDLMYTRDKRGAITSKDGFSVVAPIKINVPSSTACKRASCWALLNR